MIFIVKSFQRHPLACSEQQWHHYLLGSKTGKWSREKWFFFVARAAIFHSVKMHFCRIHPETTAQSVLIKLVHSRYQPYGWNPFAFLRLPYFAVCWRFFSFLFNKCPSAFDVHYILLLFEVKNTVWQSPRRVHRLLCFEVKKGSSAQ